MVKVPFLAVRDGGGEQWHMHGDLSLDCGSIIITLHLLCGTQANLVLSVLRRITCLSKQVLLPIFKENDLPEHH